MDLISRTDLMNDLDTSVVFSDRTHEPGEHNSEVVGAQKVINRIEAAPEVKAIPIEWIKQHIKELDTELQSLYSRFRPLMDSNEKNEALLRCVELRTMLRPYETVLSEWKKENGTD